MTHSRRYFSVSVTSFAPWGQFLELIAPLLVLACLVQTLEKLLGMYLDSTQKLRNAYNSTKTIAMHSIECKLIEVKEAKALQQILHSFLHAQARIINPQDSGFRRTLVRACPESHGWLESKKGTLAICLFPPLTAFKRACVTALNLLKADVSAHIEQGRKHASSYAFLRVLCASVVKNVKNNFLRKLYLERVFFVFWKNGSSFASISQFLKVEGITLHTIREF